MSEEKHDILIQAAHSDGMTVPDRYFEEFAAKMAASLPYRAEVEGSAEPAAPRTPWQRVRPYVYMAAMFASVWCMLHLFTLLTAPGAGTSIDSSPVIAEAINNDAFVNDYILPDLNQWEVYDELIDDGMDPEAYTEYFGD